MEANQSKIIKQAAEILLVAKKEVKELLDQLPLSNLSLATEPALQGIINRLFFLSGTPQLPETNGVVEFPPVTNFMGEEITYPMQIKVEDLTAKEADKAIFLDKVSRLYNELPSISVAGILNAYTLPEDVLVLRGVAKKAGVPGYEDKAITTAFIEEIVKAIELKQGEVAQQAAIDAAIKAEKEKQEQEEKQLAEQSNDPGNDWEEGVPSYEHTISEDDLNKNPELIEQGLKVGDVIDIPLLEAQEKAATTEALAAQQNARADEPAKESPAKDEPATESKKKSGSKK